MWCVGLLILIITQPKGCMRVTIAKEFGVVCDLVFFFLQNWAYCPAFAGSLNLTFYFYFLLFFFHLNWSKWGRGFVIVITGFVIAVFVQTGLYVHRWSFVLYKSIKCKPNRKHNYFAAIKKKTVRGGFKFGPLAETRGGGSGPVRRAQLSYLVIRNVKTTSHFFKVTPLFWAIEGQNTEWETIKGPNFRGGGGGQKSFGQRPKFTGFFFWSLP